MDRIIRIGIVFVVTTVTCLVAIVVAEGDLSWATAKLAGLTLLGVILLLGIWAVVHFNFSTLMEIGLTVAIFAGLVLGAYLLPSAMGGFRDLVDENFASKAGWWLIAPVLGTTAIALILNLHKRGRP